MEWNKPCYHLLHNQKAKSVHVVFTAWIRNIKLLHKKMQFCPATWLHLVKLSQTDSCSLWFVNHSLADTWTSAGRNVGIIKWPNANFIIAPTAHRHDAPFWQFCLKSTDLNGEFSSWGFRCQVHSNYLGTVGNGANWQSPRSLHSNWQHPPTSAIYCSIVNTEGQFFNPALIWLNFKITQRALERKNTGSSSSGGILTRPVVG